MAKKLVKAQGLILPLLIGMAAPAMALQPEERHWELAVVGDIMMGTNFPVKRLPPEGGSGIFSPAEPLLRSADLTFGNLEGPLAIGGASTKTGCSKCYAFRTPPEYARHLSEAGFDALSVANNHARDFGEDGQRQTVQALANHGIGWAGTLAQPMVILEDPLGRRCAFLAFSTGPSGPRVQELERVRNLVAHAASQAPLVVVSFHAGAEGTGTGTTPRGPEVYHGEARGDVRAFARAAVEAGADVVFGHGPHVPRGMELINDRLVMYSLGNFRTFGPFSKVGPMGLSPLVRLTVTHEGRFIAGKVWSYRQVGDSFLQDPTGRAGNWMKQKTQEDFGPSLFIDDAGEFRKQK